MGKEILMNDSAKGAAQTQFLGQGTAAAQSATHPKSQSASTDTVERSDEASVAAREFPGEMTLKDKIEEFRAQRLVEQKAAERKLLGLDCAT
jgi:hypothetical protein